MFKRWLKISNQKSSLIIGPRRSGKTTLLKTSFPNYKYITLDDLDYLSWAERDAKGLIGSLGKQAIIDEIQRYPKLTIAAKFAIDNENAHFLMTGSSSIGLLDSTADTLAGRIELYSLPTACFGENNGIPDHDVLDAQLNPAQIQQRQRFLNEALTYGQFPEVLIQDDTNDKHNLLINYRDAFFVRDLLQLSNIENREGLLAILHHIARSLGSHLEISNFARESGLSHPTTKKYLNVLNQAQLTFQLYGYQYGPAKRYIKSVKKYFADNGILHSLNIPLNEGQILENFVISEFEKRRKLGYLKCDRMYYYKSAAGRGINLLFEKDGSLIAIEIKNTKHPTERDLNNLVEFRKQMKKQVDCYLLYPGLEYLSIKDIRIIPIASLYKGV